jgi:hypothetical protein
LFVGEVNNAYCGEARLSDIKERVLIKFQGRQWGLPWKINKDVYAGLKNPGL